MSKNKENFNFREAFKKIDKIKPIFETPEGEKIYTIEDYAALAEFEKATGEQKITSKEARVPSADGTSWLKGAKIAMAVNPSIFFANVAKVVVTTEEIRTEKEVEIEKEVKAGKDVEKVVETETVEETKIIEHEEIYVVLDGRAVREHARQGLTASKVTAYVFKKLKKGIKYDRSELIKKEDFLNDFELTLGAKTVIEVRKQIEKEFDRDDDKVVDFV